MIITLQIKHTFETGFTQRFHNFYQTVRYSDTILVDTIGSDRQSVWTRKAGRLACSDPAVQAIAAQTLRSNVSSSQMKRSIVI